MLMQGDCSDCSNAMLAGVTMWVFGKRQDLPDVYARRLSRLK
jgi:hypothetical protein